MFDSFPFGPFDRPRTAITFPVTTTSPEHAGYSFQ